MELLLRRLADSAGDACSTGPAAYGDVRSAGPAAYAANETRHVLLQAPLVVRSTCRPLDAAEHDNTESQLDGPPDCARNGKGNVATPHT
jgi:hypothetical protein